MKLFLFFLLVLVSYISVFQLPYAVWTFPLTQNWFTDNGLVLFRDVVYHHNPLPLFILYFMSKILGNDVFMLQISSFLLTMFLGFGIFFVGKSFSKKVGLISLLLFILTFPSMFNNFNIEEMVAAVFTLYATYFFIKFFKMHNTKFLFYSGFCTGLGIMGKQAAVGIVIAFIAILFFELKKMKMIKFRNGILLFIAGCVLSSLPILLYYILNEALSDFLYWNIIFNLTIYPSQSQPKAFGTGFFYGGWMLLSLVPGIVLLMKEKLKQEMRIKLLLFVLATIFLVPSLLPSFHEYKLLMFYPYTIIIWSIILEYKKEKILFLFLIIGFIAFLLPAKTFYVDYLPQNLFHKDPILEYGEDDLKVVDWIKTNTKKDERIMNLGNHYITTLSHRLPKNKYVYIFPWLVMPFDVSTKEILSDPPRVVVIDNKTLSDWPVLETKWRFLSYVKKNYKLSVTYGTYTIYVSH